MCYSYILVFLVFDFTIGEIIEHDGKDEHESVKDPWENTRSDADFPSDKSFPKVAHSQDHGDDKHDEHGPGDGLSGFAFLENHVAEHEDRREQQYCAGDGDQLHS